MKTIVGNRRLPAIVVAATLAAVLAASGSAAVASPAGSAKKRPPSQAAVAATLAKGFVAARTSKQRFDAVLAVMKTLGIPVYRAKGGVLSPRARNVPRGYGLYDFEVKTIGAAFARGDTSDLTSLADTLTRMGFKLAGNPVDPEDLRGSLIRTVGRAAAAPTKRSSLVPLLLRQLGLRHRQPYDLARDVEAAKIQLDPLQRTLILSDALIASARATGGVSHARRADAAAADRPCESQTVKSLDLVSPLGKFFIELWGGLKKGTKAVVGRIASSLTFFQGEALALSVAVRAAGPIQQSTHYGPGGHDPSAGKPLDFIVRVVMQDDYGDILVKCGALIGIKFPKKGPIPGVTVFWHNNKVEDYLEKHGTVSGGGETDETGRAIQHFVPNNEKMPGFGTLRHASNTRRAIALYQSAFGNMPGAIAQFIFPKQAEFNWTIDYHKPHGLKFSGLKWRVNLCCDVGNAWFGQGTYEVVHARKCGDDPNGPWAVILRADVDWPGGAGPGTHYHGLTGGRWTPGGPIEVSGPPSSSANVSLDMSVSPMQVKAAGSDPGLIEYSVTTATVSEDVDNGAFDWSCPEAGF